MTEKVSIIIEAVDKASGVLGGVGRSLSGLGGLAAGAAVAGMAAAGAAIAGVGVAALGVEGDVRQATNALIVGTGASGQALEAMRQSVITLGGSTQGLGHDLGAIGGVMAELNTRTGLVGQELEGTTGQFLNFTRVAGGDGVRNVQLVTRVMGDWGVANEDTGQTLDMIFGASQAFGIGVDAVASKVVQFGAPMRQMGFDLETSIALFGKWEKEGVNAELAIGSLRIAAGKFARDNVPLQEGLQDTMDAIKGTTSESEALAIAMDVFGARAGPDMAAAIREGRFELDEAIEALRATEGGLDRAAESTLTFRDRFTVALSGAKLALLPLGEGLASLAEEYMPMVTDFIANQFVPAVSALAGWIGDNLPAAIAIAAEYWTNVLKPAIELARAFLNATVVPYIRDVLIPFLQVAIPVALQFLSDVWKNVLLPAITAVWNWMSTTLIPFLQNTVFPWLQEKIPAALETLRKFWENVLLPGIQAVWNFLTVRMMPIWEAIGELLGVVIPLVLTALQGIWQNVLLPAMTAVWEFIKDKLGPIFQWLKDSLIDPTSSAFETLGEKIQAVADWIRGLAGVLSEIKLPDWMTPGSPTPWEIGLIGVRNELQKLSTMNLPAFGASLNSVPSPAMAGAGGFSGSQTIINIDARGAGIGVGNELRETIKRVLREEGRTADMRIRER